MSGPARAVRRVWNGATHLSQRLWLYVVVQACFIVVGTVLVVLGGEIWVAIGTALIATGAAGFALFGYVVLTDRWTHRVEGLLDAGLRQVWSHRSTRMKDEYDRRLSAAHEAVDLLGFGQRSFREDQLGSIRTWVAGGARVRILLLDPEFPSAELAYAIQRDREEGGSSSIAADVDAFLVEAKRSGLAALDGLEIRLFRCLPTLNVFRIDDELFWGPYIVRKVSRNSPTLLVGRGPLFDTMLGHFDAIWSGPEFSRSVIWGSPGMIVGEITGTLVRVGVSV